MSDIVEQLRTIATSDVRHDLEIQILCREAAAGITALHERVGKLESYQSRVNDWMQTCFGATISADEKERNHRFLEEALELVQSSGCTKFEALQLVDYVYSREIGLPFQEVGGVAVTLNALCLAQGIDCAYAAETELSRVWTKVDQIRAKQASKPKHSPLPAAAMEGK
jgi:hypothetical protein